MVEGNVKILLEQIERVENFSGMASIWINIDSATEEETVFALQDYLREAESRSAVDDISRGGGRVHDDDEVDQPDVPYTYYIEIEGETFKASGINHIRGGRRWEDSFQYYTIEINSHESDYGMPFRNIVFDYTTEVDRDLELESIKRKLNEIKKVRFI